jgi:hypothetical protein
MPKLQHIYAKSPHVRKISKADFASAELRHDAIEANPKNRHIVEVSDEVADWLLDNEPGDWRRVDEAKGELLVDQGVGTDAEGASSTPTSASTTRRTSRNS